MKIWRVISERRDASPFPAFLALFRSEAIDINAVLESQLDLQTMVEFSNRHVRMASILSQCEEAGVLTVRKLGEPGFIEWIDGGLSSESRNLNVLGDTLRHLNGLELTNADLSDLVAEAMDALHRFCRYNNMVNTADFYPNTLTNRVMEILRKSIILNNQESPESAYCTLTTPAKTVWIQEEETDLLEIVKYVQSHPAILAQIKNYPNRIPNSSDFSEFTYMLRRHVERYFWIQYEQEGVISDIDYFYAAVIHILDGDNIASDLLDALHIRRRKPIQKANEILDTINITDTECRLIDAARCLLYWKLHLREIKIRFYCSMEPLIQIIANRLSLTTIQLRHMTVEEIQSALSGRYIPDPDLLNKRIEYSVFHFYPDGVRVLVGEEARQAFSIVTVDSATHGATAITGTCAYPGKVEGTVKQVLTMDDARHFKLGQVLVAYMTDIGVVPAMRKAAAIITDVGGVTCHAAIIARELRIPTVIGTKFGSKVLLDGYLVEVNASNGLVTILSKDQPDTADMQTIVDEDTEIFKQRISLSCTLSDGDTAPLVVDLQLLRVCDTDLAGGKGASLGTLVYHGLPIPPGFVVTSVAFLKFIKDSGIGSAIDANLSKIENYSSLSTRTHAIRSLIESTPIPNTIADEIMKRYTHLSTKTVAVRSSATAEDSSTASWAGLFDSFMEVQSQELFSAVKKCWASMFSERAIMYRLHRAMASIPLAMGVVIQEMVRADYAGTAFSMNPVNNNNQVFIESCQGLGQSVVDGSLIPATHLVDKITFNVVKSSAGSVLKKSAGGCEMSSNTGHSSQVDPECFVTISDKEATVLAKLVCLIEREYGYPVDVEWASSSGNLYILQARPITSYN